MTVIVAALLLPSLAAVTIAAPSAAPVTNPSAVTCATASLLLVQVTTRPANGAPVESWAVAVSCTNCPTDRLAAAGLIATEATGTALTMTTAESTTAAGTL